MVSENLVRSSYLTSEVEQIVSKPFYVLHAMIRARKISKPNKDASGNLTWTQANVEEVKAVLERRKAAAARKAETVAHA